MSLRRVTTGTSIAWDGGWQYVQAGQLVEIEPGSALEAAYGPENLEDLGVAAEDAGRRAVVAN